MLSARAIPPDNEKTKIKAKVIQKREKECSEKRECVKWGVQLRQTMLLCMFCLCLARAKREREREREKCPKPCTDFRADLEIMPLNAP